jgi:hypothetical protein
MMEAMTTHNPDFNWVKPPIANRDTRVAAEMNPATGMFILQGWQGTAPVTEILRLDEPTGVWPLREKTA